MEAQAVRIYHNPRCSKSREALALLVQHGLQPQVILYLETPPAPSAVKALIAKLGVAPHALVRVKEEAYPASGLRAESSAEQVAEAIQRAPILLERPIVEVGSRAVIGRPPERVLELLADIT